MRQKGKAKRLVVVMTGFLLSVTAATNVWGRTRPDTVTGVHWKEDDNGNKKAEAVWEPVEGAYGYEIQLYRDERRQGEPIKVKKNKSSYNLKKKMVKEGTYMFKVRATVKKVDRENVDGFWSDESDELYVSESFAENNQNGKEEPENQGPGEIKKGVWQQDEKGWRYCRGDGSYPTDTWFRDPADQKYYWFDGQGYMKTGWIDWEGNRYYCDQAGNPSGSMVTGEQIIDGILYYFDESGALVNPAVLPSDS